MKTAEQIKGLVRNLARENNLRAQEVLNLFLFERFLERLSVSAFKDNFVLKGGVLISSLIGIAGRTTMDIDTTLVGLAVDEASVTKIVRQILAIPRKDGIEFVLERVEPIRERDAYLNYRFHIRARFGKINCPLAIDMTTGDAITPHAIDYHFPFVFDTGFVRIRAYPIETILAEKLESLLRLNIATTRFKDFYDVHTLFTQKRKEIQIPILHKALVHTSQKSKTTFILSEWKEIVTDIKNEETLRNGWERYVSETKYIGSLSFEAVVKSLEDILSLIDL